MSAGHHIGIEVDGTTARLVEVDDGRIVAHRCERADAPADAVRVLLGRLGRTGGASVTVAWTENVDVRRLPLRTVPPAAWRAAMLEAAEEDLFVGDADIALAGMVEESPSGTLDAVVAVTAVGPLASLWELASQADVALTVPAFCLLANGTYLAIRDASAEITVVADGRPVASRSIDGGGLDALRAALHLEPTAAGVRLTRVLTGTSQVDAEAICVVDAHVERIAQQVADQVRAWRQQSVPTGTRAFVVGPGATIPSLPFRLQEAGLTASTPPLPAGLDVSALPEWDRFAYHGALAAAVTPMTAGATTTLANRDAETARVRAADRAARRRTQTLGAAVLLTAAGVLALPLLVSAAREGAAHRGEREAIERFRKVAATDTALAHVEAGRAVYSRLASSDVRWAELHRQVIAALPPGAAVESMRLSSNASTLTVDVAAAFSGEPFSAVSAWADRMRALNRPADPSAPTNTVSIRSFAYARETKTVRASLLVSIPTRPPFVEPRQLPGTGQAPDGRS